MTNYENENINQILPLPKTSPVKFPGRITDTTFELGAPRRLHATMGLPKGHSRTTPDDFLRSRKGSLAKDSTSKGAEKTKLKIKPDLPRREDRPVMGLFTDQNYVVKNAVDVILKKPVKSADEWLWTQKRNYGKVPAYLAQKPTDLAIKSGNTSDEIVHQSDGEMSRLSVDERSELLQHLKTKWASVNKAYQKLTFTLDTPAKKKRKETYERLLTEIEKDIQTIEKSCNIIILNKSNTLLKTS